MDWKKLRKRLELGTEGDSTYLRSNVRIVLEEIIDYLEAMDDEFKALS